MPDEWESSTFSYFWGHHEPTCPLVAPCRDCQTKHARTPRSCAPDALTQWREIFSWPLQPHYAEALPVHCRLVPVTYGSVAKYRIPERFPSIDTWAVPVHKVMNLKCEFRSRDLKDFLGLPASRRLVLSTVSPDLYVEALWRAGAKFNYKTYGMDLMFPGHYSTYDLDGPAYGVFNIRRQQIHAQLVQSPWAWFRLGAYVPLYCFDTIRHCPNILISCQRMQTQRARAFLERELAVADRFFPSTTRFWYISKARGVNVPRAATAVFLNQRWLMTGLFGQDLANRPLSHLSIEESLIWNLQCLLERFS